MMFFKRDISASFILPKKIFKNVFHNENNCTTIKYPTRYASARNIFTCIYNT